jgi:hypothetical protein
MKVLVGCEFSGIVRTAFAAQGHDAWSCDLLPTEIPGNHLQGDVREVLADPWDLALFFPPCTYLANSGARWWATRQREQAEALEFVRLLLAAPIPHIVLENPEGKIGSALRHHDQMIHPWEYGEPYEKKTCLWLKHLPLLQPTRLMAARTPQVWRMGQSRQRSRDRSRTYPGIARAMAQQYPAWIARGTPAEPHGRPTGGAPRGEPYV